MEPRLPAGAAVLLATVLAIGVYAGWYRLSGEVQVSPDTVAQVPERLAPLAAPTISAVAPPRSGPAPTKPAAPPAVPSPLNVLAAEIPVAPVSPGAAAAATPVATAAAPSSAREAPPTLLVRATADSWVQVWDRTGAVVFSRVLRGGETWPVPPVPGLVLTTGNAGGTVLVVDGHQTAPLGAPGEVRRDVALDPGDVKTEHLAGMAAAR